MNAQQTKSSVVLVSPPSTTETDEGVSLVQAETCKTIQMQHKFGANEKDIGDKELEERPIAIVRDRTTDAPGDFDACTEYGYKYEYAKDLQEEDIVEENGNSQETTAAQLKNRMLQATAVILQHNQERIPYVHMLGKTYHPIHDYHDRKKYEKSLFWFSYRSDFPEIVPYGIDTDAGWGCMLRAAQMLLAHTLRIHFKSNNWVPSLSPNEARKDDFVNKLLTWFADFPSKADYIYSLHNMVAAGYAKYETLPGEWWGPGTACYVLRDLVELHSQTQPSLFRVHVSSEGTVYKDAVYELMTKESKQRAEDRKRAQGAPPVSPLHPLDPAAPTNDDVKAENLEWDTSLLLLVPLRLGLDKFNESYVDSIAKSFWVPQSVGILGGRPRSARWFYGAYADATKVLGLDPHTIQAAPKRNAVKKVHLTDDYLTSVHTAYPDIYQINRLDASLAVGFYCRNKKEFLALEESVKKLKNEKSPHDLFTFVEKTPNYLSSAMGNMGLDDGDFDLDGAGPSERDDDDDDYVLL